MTALARELPTASEIRKALDTIGDPCSVAQGVPMGVDEMGLVEAVDVGADGDVAIRFRLTSPCCTMIGYFTTEAIARVGALPGVREVRVSVDQGLDWHPTMMSPSATARREANLRARLAVRPPE